MANALCLPEGRRVFSNWQRCILYCLQPFESLPLWERGAASRVGSGVVVALILA